MTRRRKARAKSSSSRRSTSTSKRGNGDNNNSNSNVNSNKNVNSNNSSDSDGKAVDIWSDVYGAYDEMRRVALLPRVQQLCAVLITCRAGFAAADAITSLRLIKGGVPKETLAMLGVSLAPVEIAFAVLASKMVTGPRPLSVWRRSYPFRLAIGLAFAASVLYVDLAG